MAATFRITIDKERTTQYTFDLLKADGTAYSLATGDKVRIAGYRRENGTAVFDQTTGDAATANGTELTHVTAVPTPADTTPQVLLNLGQADVASLVPGAPLNIEINVTDADGTPTNAVTGGIHGIADVISTLNSIVT